MTDPTWTVTLDDGALVRYGEGTLFADLPFDRVRRMAIEYGPHLHIVELTNGQRPVYFSKNQISMNPLTGEETGRRRIVCVGWQETVKGTNVKALSWLLDDGSVIHCADDPEAW